MPRGEMSRGPGEYHSDMYVNAPVTAPLTGMLGPEKSEPKKRFVPFSFMNDHTRLLKKVDASEVRGLLQGH